MEYLGDKEMRSIQCFPPFSNHYGLGLVPLSSLESLSFYCYSKSNANCAAKFAPESSSLGGYFSKATAAW